VGDGHCGGGASRSTIPIVAQARDRVHGDFLLSVITGCECWDPLSSRKRGNGVLKNAMDGDIRVS